MKAVQDVTLRFRRTVLETVTPSMLILPRRTTWMSLSGRRDHLRCGSDAYGLMQEARPQAYSRTYGTAMIWNCC
jgi:hypothetical protein